MTSTSTNRDLARCLLCVVVLAGAAALALGGCKRSPSPTAQNADSTPPRAIDTAPERGSPSSDGAASTRTGRPVQVERTAAVLAVYNNDAAGLEALLDAGADVNEEDANGYTLLHHAARVGSYDVAQLLIARGADLNRRARMNMTPLILAVRTRQSSVALMLIDSGADVNVRSGVDDVHTALSLAVRYNLDDVAARLRAAGAEM